MDSTLQYLILGTRSLGVLSSFLTEALIYFHAKRTSCCSLSLPDIPIYLWMLTDGRSFKLLGSSCFSTSIYHPCCGVPITSAVVFSAPLSSHPDRRRRRGWQLASSGRYFGPL